MLCVDDSLVYTTGSEDVVQLNVKTNETSVIIDNTTLVNIVVGSIAVLLLIIAVRLLRHSFPYAIERERERESLFKY